MGAVDDTKKIKKLKNLYSNIECQIQMTDDQDDLHLLGTLYLYAAKNILNTLYCKSATKMIIIDYITDVNKS